jgi:Ni/Co efflux regulator RcnB
MKMLMAAVSAVALIVGIASSADAQHDNHQGPDRQQQQQHGGWGRDQGGGHHWNRGERMGQGDWSNATPVDYRQHHLRRPPHGYQWRESNGQYVLAAVATGLIASIVLNAH